MRNNQDFQKTHLPNPDQRIDQQIHDLISRRQFSDAERILQARTLTEPDNPEVFYLTGVLTYFQGEVGRTIESFKKALALDPKHTDAAICLSVLYNDIGKYDEAKKVFEQANQSVNRNVQPSQQAKVDKKFAVKHLELADLYFRYHRYDEAIEEYSKAAQLDPSDLELRIRKAKSYAKKGFLIRSIQELQQLKSEFPEFLPARLQLGLLHYSQGNILDAELEWEGVIQLSPTDREALSYLQMAQKVRAGKSTPLSSTSTRADLLR